MCAKVPDVLCRGGSGTARRPWADHDPPLRWHDPPGTSARSMSCEVHEHLPVEVRPKEGPSHLCSSPSAFGETWASEYGVKSALGGRKPPVRSMKRSLPRRKEFPRQGSTGSRAWCTLAKAMEGVKCLEVQPPRTRRRRGRGTVAQRSWEQERPVSAPAVRPARRHLAGGRGTANRINSEPVKEGSAERESEWPIVLAIPWTTQPRGREGATLDRCVQRR